MSLDSTSSSTCLHLYLFTWKTGKLHAPPHWYKDHMKFRKCSVRCETPFTGKVTSLLSMDVAGHRGSLGASSSPSSVQAHLSLPECQCECTREAVRNCLSLVSPFKMRLWLWVTRTQWIGEQAERCCQNLPWRCKRTPLSHLWTRCFCLQNASLTGRTETWCILLTQLGSMLPLSTCLLRLSPSPSSISHPVAGGRWHTAALTQVLSWD